MGRLQNTHCGTLYGAAEDYREGPPMAWNFLGSRFLQGPPEAAATVALNPPYNAGVWIDEAWGAQCGMVHQGEPAD